MTMPSRNIVRTDIENGFYHVYSRGVNKDIIFRSDSEKQRFINYLNRYLSKTPINNTNGGVYQSFFGKVSIYSYALMDNHFHLLVRQEELGTLAKLMKCTLNSYVNYHNPRHNRVGPLFQSRYKAKLIDSDSYFLHISRYIHRNPDHYASYKFSSFNAFAGTSKPEPCLSLDYVLGEFDSVNDYLKFVSAYSPEKT